MPIEGETVKVEFANWTRLGTKIGVFLRYHGGRAKIDFGDMRRWLEADSSFLVYER